LVGKHDSNCSIHIFQFLDKIMLIVVRATTVCLFNITF
jgi:hypothetical protein